MAPLLATLAASGLNLLVSAIRAKGKEFVEEKLGVNLEDEVKTEEGLIKLKTLEIEREEFLIESSLEDKRLDIDNTKDARQMNARIQEADAASYLAKNAAYFLDFAIVLATIVLSGMLLFKGIPDANKELVYTALGSLFAMCITILNFHRGTSHSSRNKDAVIKTLSSDRRK